LKEDGKPPKFTEDDVIGMVTRNPNLIGIRPTGYGGADTTDESAVQMSYIIAATRPLGSVLLATLFLCLITPAIKAQLGMDPLAFHMPGR